MNAKPHILGTLLGTAVGDALGLPYEGLSRKRVAAWGEVRHRLLLGRGLCSDDTEHTLMVAAAVRANPGDIREFQRCFARKLRWWLLGFPAGVGLGTARAVLRLWMGYPPHKAGVASAGNGGAMRSAVVGVFWADDETKRREFARAACRLTHTDARAEESAVLVAEAAALASDRASTERVLSQLSALIVSGEMKTRFEALEAALASGSSVLDFAARLGCERGVSGFAPNTVAVALFAWLRHRGDFKTALRSVIACGGDTDTVAAITGGIGGAEVGEAGIPQDWIEAIGDWPRSVMHIRKVAVAMTHDSVSMPQVFWAFVLLRNVGFLAVVLLHGLRRLLPPY